MIRNENQRQIYLCLLFCELEILKAKDGHGCKKVTSVHLFIRDKYNVDSCMCHPPALGQKVITAAYQRPPKYSCPVVCLVIIILGYVLLVGGRDSFRESWVIKDNEIFTQHDY